MLLVRPPGRLPDPAAGPLASVTHLPVLLDEFLHWDGPCAHEIVGAQVVVVVHLDLRRRVSIVGGRVGEASTRQRSSARACKRADASSPRASARGCARGS